MFLDVNKVIKSKSPGLHEKIPRFVIRWIEKIIHQDEMNGFMEEHIHDSSVDFATHAIAFFKATISVENPENIPRAGRYIVVSNHPLGGIDGLALISTVGQYRKDIKFPVNDILMQITPMRDIFVPINKHGKNKQEVIMQFNEIFESDDLILYFPAGLCSRRQKEGIRDLQWKKTVIAKARETHRDIIPVFFDGRNSNRFYNLSYWRTRLGIKANLEMIFLPDEAFRQKGKNFNIIFGKPISYTQFDNTKDDQEWANWLKKQVYALTNK